MTLDEDRPRRKRRTREHILEDLSRNHVERLVLLEGHVLRRFEHDYGSDATMFHFANNGDYENGEVRFQLKATDRLNLIQQGALISFPVEIRDLLHWTKERYPYLLVVYSAADDSAYWIHVQEYAKTITEILSERRETLRVHIPSGNRLTREVIADFRLKSLAVMDDYQPKGERDVRRLAR